MIDRIARRYEGRWRQGYVRGKLRSDPIYGVAFEILRESKLPVLDIGCGIGLFSLSMRERGFREAIVGIDFDSRKIARARHAGEGDAGLQFETADAVEPREFSGNVVILDVLHYLPAAAQRELLESVAGQVAPGGVCIVRACPRDQGWRFRVTQLEELFLRASFSMKSGARHYPTIAEMSEPFARRGFEIEVRPLWGRTPFNSHLLVFRRR